MRDLPRPQDVPLTRSPRTAVRRCLAASRRLGAALAAVLVVTLLALVPAAPAATAADGKDFQAGNIITDEIFFDGRAMTRKQIQQFLREQTPQCQTLTNRLPCLKNYRMTTPDRPKDAYCKRYKGAKNERASRIIAKVAKACDVSPKALLVLLQKEQSLVTSLAPTHYQYERATGFACPDSAPCDEQYFGFFNQVYHAARQYQRYADPALFSWRPLGKNQLLYHPDSSRNCGTVTVDIKNQATRGLYIYTPYVPNAAALDNMYGTGDRCSSYGNRNFWRGFIDWFGSTQIAVRGPIQQTWLAAGGLDGAMGVQRDHEVCGKSGHYCAQRFAGGTIAKSKKKGTFTMSGPIERAWRQSGANRGPLKWPFNSAKTRKADGSTMQRFTRGYLVDSERFGLQQITNPAAKVWRKNKHRKGPLGLPRGAEKCFGKQGQRCLQPFAGGYVTTHPKRGNRAVTGKIATFWQKRNLNQGWLKFPSSNERCGKKKGETACWQSFGRARVVSSPERPVRTVRAKIARVWDKQGNKVGFPVKNRKCTKVGKGAKRHKVCSQEFTNGWIANSKRHGAFFMRARFGTLYGNNQKKLGAPTSNRKCTKKSGTKVCTQHFENGKIVKRGSKKPRIRL